MSLTLVTPPVPFVTLSEAVRHLRVDHNDDDQLISDLILVAIADLDGPDGRLGRSLGVQTWDWKPDETPSVLSVPLPPHVSVTNITYNDGSPQTVSAGTYTVSGFGTSRGAVIETDGEWPDGIVVRFVAGFPSVPMPIRQAVLLIVGELYSSGGEKVDQRFIEEPAIARLLARFWVPRL